MKFAFCSLLVTAAYVLLVAYAEHVARALGPVYAVVVLALWGLGFFDRNQGRPRA